MFNRIMKTFCNIKDRGDFGFNCHMSKKNSIHGSGDTFNFLKHHFKGPSRELSYQVDFSGFC